MIEIKRLNDLIKEKNIIIESNSMQVNELNGKLDLKSTDSNEKYIELNKALDKKEEE